MKTALVVILLFATPLAAQAVDVYKCKGADGSTIYQNEPCPQGTKELGQGEYQKAPDDPRQYYAAMQEAQRIQEEHEREAQQESYEAQQQAIRGAALDAINKDPRSMSGTAARNAQIEEQSRAWNCRNGRPELCRHTQSTAGTVTADHSSRDDWQDDEIAKMRKTQADSWKHEISDCHSTVGGNVACTTQDGQEVYGHVNDTGYGSVYGNGVDSSLHRDASGHIVTDNGTCVKDEYGNCQ